MPHLALKPYPRLARILHWTNAVIILWAMISGIIYINHVLPTRIAERIPPFNVAITTLLIPLFLLRVIYRLTFSVPALPLPSMQQRIAHAGHLAIYALTTASLLTGVLMMERPVDVFGWFDYDPILPSGPVTHLISQLHQFSNLLLGIVLIAHIGAVIKHHRHGLPVLSRMLPRRAPPIPHNACTGASINK